MKAKVGWWLAIVGGWIAYLQTQPEPWLWDYKQWLAFAFVVVTTLVAKLAPGISAGKPDAPTVNPSRFLAPLLLLLIYPSVAHAQGIRASIAPAVHEVALAHAQDPAPGTADAVVSDRALATAEWIFIGSQSFHTSYAALREHQDAESITQTIVVGVTSTAGTLALARLLPARWQRFAALVGVGVTTAIIDGREIARQVKQR